MTSAYRIDVQGYKNIFYDTYLQSLDQLMFWFHALTALPVFSFMILQHNFDFHINKYTHLYLVLDGYCMI